VAIGIGIVGAGRIGGGLARALTRAGYEIFISNQRGRVALMPLIEEIGSGAHPVRPDEAARAPLVVLAVPFGALESLLPELTVAPGTIVVDATNAWGGWDRAPSDDTSTQMVARHLPEARLVKAVNTVHASLLADPRTDGGEPLGIPVAGDDPDAVATVCGVLERIGFAPVAVGGLARGDVMEPHAPLFGVRVSGPELRALADRV
jgi:8-hydroxy-5-deazaflavin:NADPH oxidoreductase